VAAVVRCSRLWIRLWLQSTPSSSSIEFKTASWQDAISLNARLCSSDGVVAVHVEDGFVKGAYHVRNPEKLSRLDAETGMTRSIERQ
jgi:hypothetical protein